MNTQNSLNSEQCAVALKEWAVTCRALAQGRQIILLRKGGILDEDGVFRLEYSKFWLQPTYLHQDETLLQASHRELLEQVNAQRVPGDSRDFITLQFFASVSDVFALSQDDDEKLLGAAHIWSRSYLDTRFHYKPDHPLLCVALRVYELPQAIQLQMRPAWTGCRSWIELEEPISLGDTRPVLSDEEFAVQRANLRAALGA